MASTTLTSKGLQPEETGPLGRLPGLLHHLAGNRPASIAEMKEAIQRRMRKKYRPAAE